MKKFITILVIFALAASTVMAQGIYDPQLLARIGLSAEEIEEIQDIQFQMEKKIKVYNADLNILKAQLEKLLLNENPDMEKVKTIITDTVQLRSQAEIARVETRVQIRQKIGNEGWEEMLKLQTQLRQQQRAQNTTPNQNKIAPNTANGVPGQNNTNGMPNPRN